MQDSIYKYMKIGIVHFMAFPEGDSLHGNGPIAKTVEQIAEDDFFTAIELTWVNDEQEKEKVKKILETSGLAVGFAAQPPVLTISLNPNSLDEAERKEAVKVLKEQIDNAYEFGAGGMAFLSGKDPGEGKREDALAALAQSCQELCDYAKSKGELSIELESFDYDIDKEALIGPAERAVELAEMVNRNNFGLLLDLSHFPIQHESTREALTTASDYLVHAHMGNCIKKEGVPGYGDAHPRFGHPDGENGVDEVAEFLEVLFDIGYLGRENDELPFVSFEVKPMEGESSEVVVANAKRTLKEAWARVNTKSNSDMPDQLNLESDHSIIALGDIEGKTLIRE